MQFKTVHTAPWPHCLYRNVLLYDTPHSLRLGGRLFQTSGPAVAKVLSPKLPGIRLTSVPSVGRMQLSDTGIGDELTVVHQVTQGVASQEPVDESCNLEQDALPDTMPVQLAQHR